MKQILLFMGSVFLCTQVMAQPILNEMYITPGSSPCNGTTRQEFFEIYNGNQGNGNAVSNIGCYYLVTRWETGSGVGNEGFYVLDFPSNATTNTAGFYTAAATSVYGTQTGNVNPCQFTADLNWNNGTVLKKYTLAAGNTYTATTVSNVFNLFDEGLSQLTVMLFNGNRPVDIFVGGGGGNINNIVNRIQAWAPLTLTIDCVGSQQTNTINFSGIVATDIEQVNQSAGTDNGFIRKYDGNCAPWDKSSSPPFHTPGSSNGGGSIPTTEPIWTSSFSDFTCPASVGQPAVVNDTLRNIRNVTGVTVTVFTDINSNGTYDLGLDPQYGNSINVNFPANAVTQTITGIPISPDGTSFILVRMANGSTCFYTQNRITAACGPLPVTLSGFYAARNGNVVVLNWQTSMELNARHFAVQRFTGSTFETVGIVPATNISNGSQYRFTDNNTTKGTSLYRLQMADQDNSVRYSDTRSVKGLMAASNFSIYPNPSNGSARITINDVSGPTDVLVLDNTGRLLQTINLNNRNTVALTGLQKGLYVIRIIHHTDGSATSQKLTVN